MKPEDRRRLLALSSEAYLDSKISAQLDDLAIEAITALETAEARVAQLEKVIAREMHEWQEVLNAMEPAYHPLARLVLHRLAEGVQTPVKEVTP